MSDPGWYQKLTGHLTEAQKKEIQQIFVLADQRLAAKGQSLNYINLQSVNVLHNHLNWQLLYIDK